MTEMLIKKIFKNGWGNKIYLSAKDMQENDLKTGDEVLVTISKK
ncbi:MAG: hypothetical protein WCR24_05150 [Candidatus Methanomethylophilaceae archaeon]